MFVSKFITFAWIISAGVLASPHKNLNARASTSVDPNDVRDTVCGKNVLIDEHDMNVAQLQICGGIQKQITKCQGNPTETQGKSGTALFNLKPVNQGGSITVSKGRWERCVRAAKAVCPKGEYRSICKGGTSNGDLQFSLSRT